VETYQAQAADLERGGREVDAARISAIEDLQSEIEVTDRAILDREREIENVSVAYEGDIQRFRMLLEVVELRQNLLARQKAARDKAEADPRR
jgi:hypothetical protein